MSKKPLAEFVSVAESFQRAMRIDRDFAAGAIQAISEYVPQGTGIHTLSMMADHIEGSRQRAFTWTGPYGSGKSSLALLLSSLTSAGTSRDLALKRLALPKDSPVIRVFGSGEGWTVYPLTGRQGSLTADLANVFNVAPDGRAVIVALRDIAENLPSSSGLLLIIDELGKYLEADCASENTYLLQEIAETFNRTEKKTVIVGILHQAVDVYSSRLPKMLRDEWDKVKGRFVDMPLLSSTDEVLELLGRAIQSNCVVDHPFFASAVKKTAAEYADRRMRDENHIHALLTACWPLNPVVALLLGPVSRRRFSQNERSIYSFLGSREPFGFKDFLLTHDDSALYSPDMYWDYLKANFDAAIQSTADGHRWITSVNAVDRVERLGTAKHVALFKSLALLELVRSGTGLEASLSLLAASLCLSQSETKPLLDDLIKWKVAIEKHHVNGYAVFDGSDFNIEEAVADELSRQGGLDSRILEALLKLSPVVCRNHYMRTGTLRWFDRVVLPIEDLERWYDRLRDDNGTTGTFVLMIPDCSTDEGNARSVLETAVSKISLRQSNGMRIIPGVPYNGGTLRALLSELQALGEIAKRPELEGDATARREVASRISQSHDLLTSALSDAFAHALWQITERGQRASHKPSDLKSIATDVASIDYPSSPIIQNELINRDYLSSNVGSARRNLMKSMLLNEAQEELGYSGYPPDYALYLSLLKDIHCFDDQSKQWRFKTQNETEQFGDFWLMTDKFLAGKEFVSVKDLYEFWRTPPFGLRWGSMPILALAYLLANKDRIAVYENHAFVPTLSEAILDEWLADPNRIELRAISSDEEHDQYLRLLSASVSSYLGEPCSQVPLDVARGIVRIVVLSPKWTQNSTKLSPQTLKFKQIVLKASDPIQLLFKDLPFIFGTEDPEQLVKAFNEAMREYLTAMPEMIDRIRHLIISSVNASENDLEKLRSRATALRDLCGQLTLENYITRLEKFSGSQSEVEGLISFGCNKPPMRWTDADIKIAETKLTQLALEFRKLEAVAHLRGRKTSQRTFNLVMGGGDGDINEVIELNDSELTEVQNLSVKLSDILSGNNRSIALAALAEAGWAVVHRKQEE